MNEPSHTDDLPGIEALLQDPAASFWLKDTLRSAMARDPSMLQRRRVLGTIAGPKMPQDIAKGLNRLTDRSHDFTS